MKNSCTYLLIFVLAITTSGLILTSNTFSDTLTSDGEIVEMGENVDYVNKNEEVGEATTRFIACDVLGNCFPTAPGDPESGGNLDDTPSILLYPTTLSLGTAVSNFTDSSISPGTIINRAYKFVPSRNEAVRIVVNNASSYTICVYDSTYTLLTTNTNAATASFVIKKNLTRYFLVFAPANTSVSVTLQVYGYCVHAVSDYVLNNTQYAVHSSKIKYYLSGLNSTVQSWVHQAVAIWENTGSVDFEEQTSGNGTAIVVISQATSTEATWWGKYTSSWRIFYVAASIKIASFIYDDYVAGTWNVTEARAINVIAHELGHAVGLDEMYGKSPAESMLNIMNSVYFNTIPGTCDIAAYRSLWG